MQKYVYAASAGKLICSYQEGKIVTNDKTVEKVLNNFRSWSIPHTSDLIFFFPFFLFSSCLSFFFFFNPCGLYCSSCVCISVFCLYIVGFNKVQPGTGYCFFVFCFISSRQIIDSHAH